MHFHSDRGRPTSIDELDSLDVDKELVLFADLQKLNTTLNFMSFGEPIETANGLG